jgi:hypothetical protein
VILWDVFAFRGSGRACNGSAFCRARLEGGGVGFFSPFRRTPPPATPLPAAFNDRKTLALTALLHRLNAALPHFERAPRCALPTPRLY